MEGPIVHYVAGSTITSGQVVLFGARIGIAQASVASGATVALRVLGIWTVAKLSTDAMTQGALLYWDNTNSRLTTTSTGNTLAGFCATAAGAGTTTVEISINA